MNEFKRGTPGFGILLGGLFVLAGGLVMWIGIWRTLVLIALFAAGYFLGSVKDPSAAAKGLVNRVVPEQKATPIDFRGEIKREQEQLQAQAFGKQREQEDALNGTPDDPEMNEANGEEE